ncbi:MAG: hypothetical protein R3Y57_05640 [Erysipelotrichaceae bacterium]
MDAFLEAAKNLAEQLVPTLLAIVLVLAIMTFYQIYKLVQETRNNLKGIDRTVALVNDSLDKVQTPLDTVKSVSESVEKVHQSGIIAVQQAISYIIANYQVIKEYIEERKEEKRQGETQDGK